MQFLSHRFLQRRVYPVRKSLDLLRGILKHTESEKLQVSSSERQTACEHLVCDNSQRVLVRQRIQIPSFPLFRSEVGKFDLRT